MRIAGTQATKWKSGDLEVCEVHSLEYYRLGFEVYQAAEIWNMRKQGYTWPEISKRMKLSIARCHRAFEFWQKKEKLLDWRLRYV